MSGELCSWTKSRSGLRVLFSKSEGALENMEGLREWYGRCGEKSGWEGQEDQGGTFLQIRRNDYLVLRGRGGRERVLTG